MYIYTYNCNRTAINLDFTESRCKNTCIIFPYKTQISFSHVFVESIVFLNIIHPAHLHTTIRLFITYL